jgi:hypothetical protein
VSSLQGVVWFSTLEKFATDARTGRRSGS